MIQILDKCYHQIDLKTSDLSRTLAATKELLEAQIAYNSKNINSVQDKINTSINSRLEEFSGKVNKGLNETVQLNKEMRDLREELVQTSRKAHQNQTHITELLNHLSMQFNETNELELSLRGLNRKDMDSTQHLTQRAQIKAIHMELKNMTNKLPLYTAHVISDDFLPPLIDLPII